MTSAEEGSLGLACFVDVETTGLSPRKEEIVELAICLFAYRRDSGEITRIVDRYVGQREPGVPVSPGAARVHGLRMADLRGKQLDTARIEAILHSAEFIVAHNASFDRGFVARLFPVSGRKQWLCSMSGIDWKGKGFPSRGLQNLLRAHRIDAGRAHRAEDDVLATLKLLACCDHSGKTYSKELIERLPDCSDSVGEAG
ncbi:exonuclease domain-containing protein [Dethiobacter alkaliphilus]|uniref:Exonuclease RNase T and DNA polymerase III n=1 Tax=Dethiobacter alkaliphilus AHT 1 TaxID=555088 RepID=C0GGY8_DETAL|nr:exonuclease domain-containing protein [Dethiobacter alkaliphilus]EEG77290.1 Exonuclease RNase T and DNA polymerase III [Dethiobacter alkaliphilus AHT 1]